MEAQRDLRGYLQTAVRQENLALSTFPEAFFLGKSGQEATNMVRWCYERPCRPELGEVGYVDEYGKLRFGGRIRAGACGVIFPTIEGTRKAITIQTLSGDPSARFEKLGPVLISKKEEDAAVAVLLATPTTKLLAVRTGQGDGLPRYVFDYFSRRANEEDGYEPVKRLFNEYRENGSLKIYTCPIEENTALQVA